MSCLPNEVHVEIVKQLQPLLVTVEYFLDLRRVSSKIH